MDSFSENDIQIGDYRGRVNTVRVNDASRAWLAQIATHVKADGVDVLAEGRNRNTRVVMPLDGTPTTEVVVKSFGGTGMLKDWRSRKVGSKARRTWMAGVHLITKGAGTPEPIAFLERWAGRRLLESHVVTVYQHDSLSFAHALDMIYRHHPECQTLMALLQVVADGIRLMHESGFMHNDLGNQNILIQRDPSGHWHNVQFIDLNRGRIKGVLTDQERARDLSRITLPSDFRRVFFEMIFQIAPTDGFLAWERRYRRRFAVHSRTRRWRHPIREARKRPAPGDPPTYPDAKDLWIWDERSGQPLVTMVSRDRAKLYPFSRNLQITISTLKALPRVWRRYLELRANAFSQPVLMNDRLGVAVDVSVPDWEARVALLQRLGRLPVMVRFYHHRGLSVADQSIEIVEQLLERGFPVSIALVQDRQAVNDPVSWSEFVDRVLRALAQKVDLVEVGHAINRVKWGIWDFADYRSLMEPLLAWQQRMPSLMLSGPAVIDFEYAYIPAALDALPGGLRFGALSHHLYVDRRGAPETPQGRFATLEKVALARALADRTGERLIVSEFNWPLKGTGVYSPVGAPYVSPGERFHDPSVSEDEAAAYLVRYFLIAICSGLVERIFWWRLVAFGYGLVDDSVSPWRARPGFVALERLLPRLEGSIFTQRKQFKNGDADVILFRFENADKSPWWMAYTTGKACRIALPEGARLASTILGASVSCDAGQVELTMMPVYLD